MHLFCVELYLIRGGDFQQDGKIVKRFDEVNKSCS